MSSGETFYWNSTTGSTDWLTPSNWYSPSGSLQTPLPIVGDGVIILSGCPTPPVVVLNYLTDTTTTLASLSLGNGCSPTLNAQLVLETPLVVQDNFEAGLYSEIILENYGVLTLPTPSIPEEFPVIINSTISINNLTLARTCLSFTSTMTEVQLMQPFSLKNSSCSVYGLYSIAFWGPFAMSGANSIFDLTGTSTADFHSNVSIISAPNFGFTLSQIATFHASLTLSNSQGTIGGAVSITVLGPVLVDPGSSLTLNGNIYTPGSWHIDGTVDFVGTNGVNFQGGSSISGGGTISILGGFVITDATGMISLSFDPERTGNCTQTTIG